MSNEQIIDLINTSIDGIIKIIEKCGKEEKKLLLKSIFFKAIGALEKSSDIVQFLILFDKLSNNKYISGIFNYILEDYYKDYGFLTSLMNDMTRYLCLIDSFKKNDKIKDINILDEIEEKNIYEGLFDNKLNIELRLKLIIFLFENEINENDLMNFKKLMSTCETNIIANKCLNKLIYSNIKNFEPIFIIFLYDNILDNNKNYDVNDLQFYKLCKEIIKQINSINQIFYFMNNKDIAILNCESEEKIKGINILWNFLIKTKNDIIRNDITDFLANIFLGIKFDIKEKIEIYWKNFIRTIYNKLDEIIDKNDSEDDPAIKGIISLIKKIEKYSNENGEIIEDISMIINEIKFNKNMKSQKKKKNKNPPKNCMFIGNSSENSEKLINHDINIDCTEYFYMLRYKLSNLFKIPLNTVKIIIDEDAYDKKLPEELKNVEFDLFNDFDNTFILLENIEKKIMSINNENNTKEKEKKQKKEKNEEKKGNKKNKERNAEYILDVLILIKDEAQINNNKNIIEDIKEILLKQNSEKLNSIFDFTDTNIFYISYILSNLIQVINEINEKDKNFINKIFLRNRVWTEKIKNIKIENSNKPFLEEIYEKNNIIKCLLNIFKIISKQIKNDENISLFILNNIIEYYYSMVKDSIFINLKLLPFLSESGINIQIIENIYIENSKLIEEIIIENNIYENFIKMLLLNQGNIQKQFKFLYFEGILKNKIYNLNQNLQSFLKSIINIIFTNNKKKIEDNEQIKNEFSIFLINTFLNEEIFQKIINFIKEISLDKNLEVSDLEIFEKNIQLFFDTIIYVIAKIYPTIYASSWYLTCFTNILSFEQVLRIMDCFFFEGIKILHRISLGILALNRDNILKSKTAADVMGAMKNMTEHIDIEELFKVSFGFSISKKQIAKYEELYNDLKNGRKTGDEDIMNQVNC